MMPRAGPAPSGTGIYLEVPGLGEMVIRADGDTNPAVGSSRGVTPLPGRDFRFA